MLQLLVIPVCFDLMKKIIFSLTNLTILKWRSFTHFLKDTEYVNFTFTNDISMKAFMKCITRIKWLNSLNVFCVYSWLTIILIFQYEYQYINIITVNEKYILSLMEGAWTAGRVLETITLNYGCCRIIVLIT